MKYEEINNVPVVTMDNVFNEQQLDALWSVINLFDADKLYMPSGKSVQCSHRGVLLDQVFNPSFKDVLPYTKVIGDTIKVLQGLVKNKHPVFRPFCNNHAVTPKMLLSNYCNGDVYEEHIDECQLAMLIWLSEEEFDGGDLVIEGEHTIPFQNNRVVLLPGYAKHRVTEMRGDGRWCFTIFMRLR